MAATEWVRIQHPDTEGTAMVAARSLDHWLSRGWTEAPEPPKPTRPSRPRSPKPAAPAAPAPPKAAPKPADNPKDEG